MIVMKGYGAPVRERGGNKVSWYVYATRAEAEEAAKQASEDRDRMLRNGFEFGYCWPGEIRETDDGLFELTVP